MKQQILLAFFLFGSFVLHAQSLIEAVKQNNFAKVQMLVTAENINEPDENLATPLMWAVYAGDLDMVKWLVEKGSDPFIKGVIYPPDDTNGYYGSLLGIAAAEGKLEILQFLIEKCKVDINDKEYDPTAQEEIGWTALHWAANKGRNDVVSYLVKKGQNVNIGQDISNSTPLILATQNEHQETVKLLIELGASTEMKNDLGISAIHYAAINDNSEIVKLLLENGADVNSVMNDGNTALHTAAQYFYEKLYYFLLESGADSTMRNQEGEKASDLYESYKLTFEYQIELAESALYLGKYQDALIKINEIEGFFNEITSENVEEYILFLNTRGRILFKIGNMLDAAMDFREALLITEKVQGKDHPNYGNILNSLAVIYRTIGQYKKALTLYLEVLEITERTLGKDHPDYGMCLNNLALLYISMGEYDKALPMSLEALEITEKTQGKDHPDYGFSLVNLAILYQSMGQYENALPLSMEALENTEKTLGKDHPNYGTCLNNLAILYQSMGQYENALPLSMEALENTEKTLGKDHPEYGTCLNNLATLYRSMGQYEKVLPLSMQALEITEKAFGKDHPKYGTMLNNLAVTYIIFGKYDEAIGLSMEAMKSTEKAVGTDHTDYGKRLSNLALLYSSMGQYNKALSLNLEALQNTEKALGKDHYFYGTILNNLAMLYHSMGQHDKAITLGLEALENTEKSLGKDHPEYGTRLNNLSLQYGSLGQNEKALPYSLEAIDNTERALGKDHPEYGTIVSNLAILYFNLGQVEEALPLLLESLEITENALGKNHLNYGTNLNNLAGLYQSMGQYDKALPLYIEAQQNSLYNLEKNFRFLNEGEKQQYATMVLGVFKMYLSFYAAYQDKDPAVSKDAYDIALATSGMILQSSIQMRQAIEGSGDENLISGFEAWLSLKRQINFLSNQPIAKRYANVDSLNTSADEIESQLVKESQAFNAFESSFKAKWQDVQQGLKQDEAAIEFISFRFHADNRWTDSTFYYALLLRKDDAYPQMIQLCEERQLISLLPKQGMNSPQQYNLAYHGNRGTGVAFYEQEAKGDTLYKLLWKPLESLLGGIETIYFAPTGLMHTIALSAIPSPSGALLMESYKLVQVSSTRLLALQQEPVKLKDAVVYGGIKYDMDAGQLAMNASLYTNEEALVYSYPQMRGMEKKYAGFSYLEGTMEEANQIEALLKGKMATRKITGEAAVEESFVQLTGKASPSVLHLATHGFYFPDTISIQQDRDMLLIDASGENRFRYTDDPLMRSALVMAGANRAWNGLDLPEGVEDGILTAKDVSTMNLSNTKLVVLSACQTGLGDVKGSEGVSGLQRAFKMAGVQYIMMSLWPVADKETAEYMGMFYTGLTNGTGIREAFWHTQQQMKTLYPNDPSKWAGFVLVE